MVALLYVITSSTSLLSALHDDPSTVSDDVSRNRSTVKTDSILNQKMARRAEEAASVEPSPVASCDSLARTHRTSRGTMKTFAVPTTLSLLRITLEKRFRPFFRERVRFEVCFFEVVSFSSSSNPKEELHVFDRQRGDLRAPFHALTSVDLWKHAN